MTTEIGQIGQRLSDPHRVAEGNELSDGATKISATMTKLFRQPKNGGNPFLFAFTAPKPHELTIEIQGQKIDTAATDGRKYYWNPKFLAKLHHNEVDIVMQHEAYHTVFYHSERLRGCDSQVRNISLDYVVNAVIEVDHERNSRPGALWGGNLGEPLLFKKLLEFIDGKIEFGDGVYCYADKSLHGRSPESIYDEIMQHWAKSPRKCPVCGALSLDPKTGKPKKGQKGKQPGKGKGKNKGDEEGQGQGKDEEGQGQGQGQPGDGQGQGGQQPGDGDGEGEGQGDGQGQGGQQPGDGDGDGEGCCCPHCGAKPGHGQGDASGKGVRGLPSTMDGHIDAKATKQEVQSDTMRAVQQSTAMRGTVPAEVESVLGELMKPQIRFIDLVRSAMMRKRQDAGMKNDWKRFRKRYIAANPRQYLPKRHSHFPRWLALLDTSGSMSDDDITYEVSQLQILGNQTEGFVVPVDAMVHWGAVTQVKDLRDLKRVKVAGRGGTVFDYFFKEFPTKLGIDFDVVIILTDGYCGQIPMELKPKIDCVWVITNNGDKSYKPSFGRKVLLRQERL